MARIRTVKPEYWSDGDMLKLSRDARLFYIGLWNFADDNGVLEYDLVSLKARIFPVDRINIHKLLTELDKIGKILIYEVENRKYLLVKNLVNHQVIDRPRKSKLPLPDSSQLKSIEINGIDTMKIIAGRKEGREGKGEITQSPKNRFLEFVLLTKKEYQTLLEDLGEPTTKEYIERLNNYIGAKGKEYKSHYHAIRTWVKKDKPKEQNTSITLRRPL